MPYLIECLLEIYEDMIQALLMLKVFLAKDSKVEDLFTGAPSCSKTCLFFSDDLFCLGFDCSVGNFPGNKSISQDGGKYREILGNIGKYWEIWKVCSYLVI